MTRHLLALAAATALGTVSAPAVAQQAAPPPAWADPQAPLPPGPPPLPAPRHGGPDGYGAPYAHALPPGVYPGPMPYPPQGMPYPGGLEPYRGPMAWHGEAYDGGGYWYAYQAGSPCGCPGSTWVQVPVETRYRYSEPVRHVEEVVEEKVVREPVVERKIVRTPPRQVKYVKAAPTKTTRVVKSAK